MVSKDLGLLGQRLRRLGLPDLVNYIGNSIKLEFQLKNERFFSKLFLVKYYFQILVCDQISNNPHKKKFLWIMQLVFFIKPDLSFIQYLASKFMSVSGFMCIILHIYLFGICT